MDSALDRVHLADGREKELAWPVDFWRLLGEDLARHGFQALYTRLEAIAHVPFL